VTTHRALNYLGSTRNLAGCAGGLIGLTLYALGAVGGFVGLLLVIGLYLAASYAMPRDRVRLVLPEAEPDAVRLRQDLETLMSRIRSEQARLPERSLLTLARIAAVLGGTLRLSKNLDEDTLHRIAQLIRFELPLAVQNYLNLPWWSAITKLLNREHPAGRELRTRLDLLLSDTERIAVRTRQ
jgi:hypothetical protein